MRVNQELVDVEHLPSPDPQIRRFRDHTRACVWLFCVDYHNTIRMRILDDRNIQLSVEPNNSKFRYGVFSWRTEPVATDRTRLIFRSESIPGFWIPTTGMLESRMRRGILSMVQRMECEYRQDPVCRDAESQDSTKNNS